VVVEGGVGQVRTLASIQTINAGWDYCARCLDCSRRTPAHENETAALPALLHERGKRA
jgi:hypothetical protein